MELEILPGRYAVCRLQPDSVQPIWARQPAGGELLSVTWSNSELSVVCPEDRVPNGVVAERSFTAIRVRGILDFALVGVLASLTFTLSHEGIPVFAISTHDTDYLLVRVEDTERSAAALVAAGHEVASAVDGDGPDGTELLGERGNPVTRAAITPSLLPTLV